MSNQLVRPVIDDPSFDKIRHFITRNYGIKLEPSKRSLVESRLSSRLRELGFNTYQAYLAYVFQKKNIQELNLLVDLITTNKTDFFRESSHFDFLQKHILPEFAGGKSTDLQFKIWSAACSSGEEVYTLAMVLDDFNRKQRLNFSLKGSDLSHRVLVKARDAVYHLKQLIPVPEEFKKRYMLKSRDPQKLVARFKPEIRNKVSFFQKNLMDADYGTEKFHLIFCRNALIYFDKDKQQEVVNKLVKQLYPGGYLFLGHSESLLGMNVKVKQIKPTIYRKEA